MRGTINLSRLRKGGFEIVGPDQYDQIGWTVAAAGDVNGDGAADFIVAGPGTSGPIYVLFGHANAKVGHVQLDHLTRSEGFEVVVPAGLDGTYNASATAGDFNGDGISDLIFGLPYNNGHGDRSGAAYVVFGRAGASPNVDLGRLQPNQGFALIGKFDEYAGGSVSSAGDVNGDGYDDLIFGAPHYSLDANYAGAAYLIFGHAGPAGTIDLSHISADQGLIFRGAEQDDLAGRAVAGVGDFNGDGLDDFAINVPQNREEKSESYVIFGKAEGLSSALLDGNRPADALLILGRAGEHDGFAVSSAGDVNGDGFADMLIGSDSSSAFGPEGQAYLIFGRPFGETEIDLDHLSAADGVTFHTQQSGDFLGEEVAAAGDFNGDGFADFLIGTSSENGFMKTYLVFGAANDLHDMDLDQMTPAQGLFLTGSAGQSISGAGDINGDGFGDVLIGNSRSAQNGDYSGITYVVYGIAPSSAVTRVGTDASQTLAGGSQGDSLRGLGGDDLLFGNGGDDNLTGGAGADALRGGDGDDVLTGGFGADILSGGLGDDQFVFSGLKDSSGRYGDTITDFVRGDIIDLSAIDADQTAAGNQMFHLAPISDRAGALVVTYDLSTNVTTISLFVDADSHVDGIVFLGGNHLDLAAGDFIL